ncbi:hypothetical protein P3L10_010157 [Capsicum annuum]
MDHLQHTILIEDLDMELKVGSFYSQYCDGGAFTGDIKSVDPATNLHFRGARIFDAVIEVLLAKELSNAKNIWIYISVTKIMHFKNDTRIVFLPRKHTTRYQDAIFLL